MEKQSINVLKRKVAELTQQNSDIVMLLLKQKDINEGIEERLKKLEEAKQCCDTAEQVEA